MAGILNAEVGIPVPFPALDQYGPNTSILLHGDGTNGAQNNTFLDSSTNNFTITRNGNTTQGTFSPFSQPDGYWSNYFNGSSRLQVPNNAAFTLNGDFTIEAWIYPTSSVANASIFAEHSNGIDFGFNPSSNLSYGQNFVNWVLQSSSTVPLNAWSHVAISRQSNSVRLYINGTSVASGTDSATYNSQTTNYIGYSGSTYFPGYISNFRLVKGTAVYTGATYTVPTSPLTAITNTSVLTCQSNRFVDNSTNAFAITTSGSPSVQAFHPISAPTAYYPAVNGGAGYFDGSGDYLSATLAGQSPGSSAFTYECWIYPILSQTFGVMNTRSGDTSDGFDWSVATNGSSSCSYTGSVFLSSSTGAVRQNSWNHMAIVYNGSGTWTLYINGVSSATRSASQTFTSTTFNLGVTAIAGNPALGYFGGFRYTKSAVYTGAFTPPTAPPTAITNTQLLLNFQNAGIIDSVSQNQVETVGNAQVSTTQSKFGGASMYFNGSTDYLSVPISPALCLTGDFTIEAWVYPTSLAGTNGNCVCAEWRGGPVTNAFFLRIMSTGLIIFGCSSGGVTGTTAKVSINTWSHIAITSKDSTLRIFVNGNMDATTGTGTISAPVYPLLIGVLNTQYDYSYYTGYIDDFRITNGVARYTQNFTPPQNAYPDYGPLTNIPTIDPNFKNTTLLLHGNGTNGAQNNTFLDSSTNNFTITRNGNTTQGTFTPFSQPNGWWSNYFNGSSDYLTIPATSAFTIATSSTPFTVEAWVYLTSEYTTYNNCLFTNSYTGSTVSLVAAFTTSAGFSSGTGGLYPAFGFYSGFWNTAAVSTTPIKLNTWTHVAFVFTGSTSKVYINGSDVTGSTVATSWGVTGATGRPWYIGYKWDGPVTFNGYISNLRFVNGTAVYTSNFTPTNYPLTAISNTALLTNQSNRFVDNSTNALTLTPTGTPTVQNFYPFFPPLDYSTAAIGGSAYFDGSGDYLSLTNNSNLQFGTGDFTVELWAYCTYFAYSSTNVIASTYQGSTNGWTFGIFTGTNKYYFALAGDTVQINDANALILNQWTHLCAVRSGTNLSFYVNGVRQGTATNSTNQTSTSGLTIGTNVGGGSLNFFGYISNIRAVKGTAVYDPTQTSITIPTAPLTPITNTQFLMSATNAGIFDNASKNDLETVGNAQISTTQSKFGGSSMYFDGTGDYLVSPYSKNFVFGGDFTVEFWLYYTAHDNYGGLISFETSVGAGPLVGWQLLWNSTSNNILYQSKDGNITSSSTVASSFWTHIALCRSSGVATLYINGNSNGTLSSTSILDSGSYPLYVGVERTVVAYTTGYIDDLRITNGFARYRYNFTPPAAQFPNK